MNTLKAVGYDVDNVGFAIRWDFIRARAPALILQDTVNYEGKRFVRFAGPFGGKKGNGLVSTGVRARNFVVEAPHLGIGTQVAWTTESHGESIVLQGPKYVIAAVRDGEWVEVDEGTISVTLPIQEGWLRVVAIEHNVWVYIDEFLCIDLSAR